MHGMVNLGVRYSRHLGALLALVLALGALQCAAAGFGDEGSVAICCVRNDGASDLAADANFGQSEVDCSSACSGIAFLQGVGFFATPVVTPAHELAGNHVIGRSLAPDPHPPRLLIPA